MGKFLLTNIPFGSFFVFWVFQIRRTFDQLIYCTIYEYLTLLALVGLYTEHKFTECIKYDYNNVI